MSVEPLQVVCDCLLVEKIAGYGPSRAWQLTLALGVVSWSAGNAVLALTHDPVLVPAVALVGSFVVPGTLLMALMEYVARRQDQTSSSLELPGLATELGPLRLMLAFLAGGALGLWPSILLEFVLEKASVFLYLPSVLPDWPSSANSSGVNPRRWAVPHMRGFARRFSSSLLDLWVEPLGR